MTSIAEKSLNDIGQPCDGGTTFARSSRARTLEPMLFSAETPAKPTAQPVDPQQRVSAVSSCELLKRFVRVLFSEKIPATSARTLPGLGGDSELAWNRLVTLACPSDCEPVALVATTGEKDCSCSVSWPTPTACSWRGGTTKDHPRANRETTFHHWWVRKFGLPYPSIEVMEAVMGFPAMWSECEELETRSARKSRSGSGDD